MCFVLFRNASCVLHGPLRRGSDSPALFGDEGAEVPWVELRDVNRDGRNDLVLAVMGEQVGRVSMGGGGIVRLYYGSVVYYGGA